MSRSVAITIDNRTWDRMAEEALSAGIDFATYVGRTLNAVAADRDALAAGKRVAGARAADPHRTPPTPSAPRLTHEHWDAVDAALERAGIVPNRTGRAT